MEDKQSNFQAALADTEMIADSEMMKDEQNNSQTALADTEMAPDSKMMKDRQNNSQGALADTEMATDSEMMTLAIESEEATDQANTSLSSQDSRKRAIEDELEPALERVISTAPSCSANLIRIDKDQFRIGRKPDNDAVIMDVFISRNHCLLERDRSTDNWHVTNLSSTDTLLNNRQLARNVPEVIKQGDILQLSLTDSFIYKFIFIKKNQESAKQPKLESTDCKLDSVLHKQKSFVQWQENERKDLETQLNAKQQEQERMKQELEQLLQDQKVTKTCNEELNNQIAELQKKIELGNASELELQQKYRDLLGKLEEERLKFEKMLAEEKQKWQQVLKETKQEKEKLEMTMVEQMEEWREKLEKKQQEEWQKKMDSLLQEEKSVQTKLQDEKQLLEQKLKEMEEALKERERINQEQQNALAVIAQPVEIANCVVIERIDSKNIQHIQDLPILETIDLTDGETSCSSKTQCKEEAVIDKVNNIMDENLTCSICSELFVRAMTLNCMHTFCRYCIDSWIKRRRDCPNCRAPIIAMTRSLVVDNFIEKMLESLTPEQMEKRQKLIEERRVLSTVVIKKRGSRRR